MEVLVNFFQAQNTFGVLALVSFACIFGFLFRSWLKRTKPRLALGVATAVPLVFAVLAATTHLMSVRRVLDSDIVDIVNPLAGVQLALELMWGGIILSSILGIVSMLVGARARKQT